jgi:hypothetical protein
MARRAATSAIPTAISSRLGRAPNSPTADALPRPGCRPGSSRMRARQFDGRFRSSVATHTHRAPGSFIVSRAIQKSEGVSPR